MSSREQPRRSDHNRPFHGKNQRHGSFRDRKPGGRRPFHRPPQEQDIPQGPPQPFSGVLEISGPDRVAVRGLSIGFMRRPPDPVVTPFMVRDLRLRNGCFLEGVMRANRKGRNVVTEVHRVCGIAPEAWKNAVLFDKGTVIAPEEFLRMEDGSDNPSMRIVDLVCPVGLGQRALIVAGARTGKTILIQQMAQSVAAMNAGKKVVMLLVDERPEEITDMVRSVKGEIFGSSNDRDAESHLRVARLTIEYVKRWVEAGTDVVMFIDSLTRLGRAFNRLQDSSGRTMSGGVDIRALEIPRQIFGAARKIEGGGSLTIIATILVDTGSRMDEVIFEEFKGTGNMELVLDRQMVEERIFPAINIAKSGTRREEQLWGDWTEPLQMLRRYLSKLYPKQATQKLIEIVKRTPHNAALIEALRSGAI